MDIRPLIKEDFLTIQEDETLSALIGKLKTSEKRDALVFDHDKFVGIIEDKWLLRAKLDASKIKLSRFLRKIPLAPPETDLIEAAYLMYQSDISFLPIIDHKKILGIVYALDLIKEAAKLEPLRDLTLNSIKLTKVPPLKAQDPISAALAIMFLKKVEQVPLTEQGKLTGLLSYRDILKRYYPFPAKRDHSAYGGGHQSKAFAPDRPEVDRLPVESFATLQNLQTITKEGKLSQAIDLMHQKNLTDLIVVRGQEPLGLLTIKNILRKIASLKIPQNFNIQFVGLEKTRLEPYQKYNLKKIASLEAFKLQRKIHNLFTLTIHIKEYEKEGKQCKYAVNLKVEYPGQIISSNRGWGGTWDLETSLRKAFINADNALKSKFRGDSSRRKPYE